MTASGVWDSVRDMIAQQKLVQAVETIEECLKPHRDGPKGDRIRDWLNELVLHTADARAVQIELRKGVITDEQARVRIHRISRNLLNLVSIIKDENICQTKNKTSVLHGSASLTPVGSGSSSLGTPAPAVTADKRARFEDVVARVRAYCAGQRIAPPKTFISYAWGETAHERWVERQLAPDLQQAGIDILLDRWHNAQIGSNVPRFVELIEQCDRIVVVGTPAYRRKYENKDPDTGYVVAAEVDVISNRLIGTEAQKKSVLPLLLDGDKVSSLPPLLHGRVFADFRDPACYEMTAFDLILSLYQLAPNHPSIVGLRDALRG